MATKVLVAEDSSTMRSLIATTVEEIDGIEVVEAGDGFEVLRTLPKQRIDLIILDINMPDINGLEIIHFVKGNPNYQRIPIIIVTTEQGEEDRKKGLALGASEFVTKPFDPENLRQIVTRLVKNTGRGKRE